MGPDHPDVAALRSNLGFVLHDLGDLSGARAEFERALQDQRSGTGSRPPHRRPPAVGNLGRVLHALGDLSGARVQLERGLKITEAALGPDHLNVGWRRDFLGRVLHDLGDLSGARAQLERALQISEAALGPNHSHVGIRRGNLGRVLHDLGDVSGARDQFERALQIMETAPGADHPQVGDLRGVPRSLAAGPGGPVRRPRPTGAGRADQPVGIGPRPPHRRRLAGNLGHVLNDLGDLPGARAQLERALQITEAAFGPDNSTVCAIRGRLGAVVGALEGYRPD